MVVHVHVDLLKTYGVLSLLVEHVRGGEFKVRLEKLPVLSEEQFVSDAPLAINQVRLLEQLQLLVYQGLLELDEAGLDDFAAIPHILV